MHTSCCEEGIYRRGVETWILAKSGEITVGYVPIRHSRILCTYPVHENYSAIPPRPRKVARGRSPAHTLRGSSAALTALTHTYIHTSLLSSSPSFQHGALFRSSRGPCGARIILLHGLCDPARDPRARGALDYQHVAQGPGRAFIFAHQQSDELCRKGEQSLSSLLLLPPPPLCCNVVGSMSPTSTSQQRNSETRAIFGVDTTVVLLGNCPRQQTLVSCHPFLHVMYAL